MVLWTWSCGPQAEAHSNILGSVFGAFKDLAQQNSADENSPKSLAIRSPQIEYALMRLFQECIS
jgi:hypothetical protein